MTTRIEFLGSTSSNLGVDLVYAVARGTFFVRNVVQPAKNGTASVSGMALDQSSPTASVTLLNVEDHEIAQQIQANQKLIALLHEWISGTPTEADPDFEQQKRDFENDRPSTRRLF